MRGGVMCPVEPMVPVVPVLGLVWSGTYHHHGVCLEITSPPPMPGSDPETADLRWGRGRRGLPGRRGGGGQLQRRGGGVSGLGGLGLLVTVLRLLWTRYTQKSLVLSIYSSWPPTFGFHHSYNRMYHCLKLFSSFV